MKARGSISFSYVLSSEQLRNASSYSPTVKRVLVHKSFVTESRATNTKHVTSSIFHASPEQMFGSV